MKHPPIWQLINSMSSQEKRYFKRNYINHLNNNQNTPLFIQLFDCICKQDNYDEFQILNELHPNLHKKNLAITKKYLYNELCKSFVLNAGEHLVGTRIYDEVTIIKILRSKRLYKLALKHWEKAYQQAIKFEIFPLIIQLKEEYAKIQMYDLQKIKLTNLHDSLEVNLYQANQYIIYLQLQDLYLKSILIRKASHFRISDENIIQINVILNHPLLTQPIESESFLVNYYYLMVKTILLFLLNDASCYNLALQNISAWHNKDYFIENYPEYYIEILYIFYYAAILANDYSKIESFMQMPANNKILLPSYVSYIETIQHLALNRVYNRTGQYDKVKITVDKIIKNYPTWNEHINTELNRTLMLSTGIACFALQQYEDAFHFTKNGLLLFNDETRIEQFSFGYLFSLIICFEWKNDYLFEIQYKNSYAYFSKNRTKESFERKLLVFFSKLFYAKSSEERKATFEQIINFIQNFKDQHYIQMIFNYFNIPGWIQSKIENKNYKDWVLEQKK